MSRRSREVAVTRKDHAPSTRDRRYRATSSDAGKPKRELEWKWRTGLGSRGARRVRRQELMHALEWKLGTQETRRS